MMIVVINSKMNGGRDLVGQLIHAAQHDTLGDVEEILENPVLNNATLDHFGHEAVSIAVLFNRQEIALRLIQHPRIQAGQALKYSMTRDNPDIIQAILNHPLTNLENISDAIRTAVDHRRDTELCQVLRDPRARLHELHKFIWNQISTTATFNMYLNDRDKNKSILNILTNHWVTHFPNQPLPKNAVMEYTDNMYAYERPRPEKTWARRRHALLLWHIAHQCEYE